MMKYFDLDWIFLKGIFGFILMNLGQYLDFFWIDGLASKISWFFGAILLLLSIYLRILEIKKIKKK